MLFNEALDYLKRKNINEAIKLFHEILQTNPHDKPAQCYLKFCQKWQQKK